MEWPRIDSLESYFVKFYHEIFKAENASRSVRANRISLKKVKKAFNFHKTSKAGIRFNRSRVRCAYLFQYATLFSSTVAIHFLNLLQQNQDVLGKLLARETLVICCLGGGPATELPAIARILEQMSCHHPGRRTSQIIHAIVVDIDSGWSVTAQHVVRSLNTSPWLQFRLTFIQADLAGPLTKELRDALREADIVTAVKFISAAYSAKGARETKRMLQRIIRLMSDGSLLFCLDSSVEKYFRVFMDSMRSSESMTQIYGPFPQDVYVLSSFTVKESYKLFHGNYGKQHFASKTKNYVSSWGKRECQSLPSPPVSISPGTNNWTSYPWNAQRFDYQAFNHTVEASMAPTNIYHLEPFLMTDIASQRRRARYFENTRWDARESEAGPPGDKRELDEHMALTNNHRLETFQVTRRTTASNMKRTFCFGNNVWNCMTETDVGPPGKKRRYF